MLREPLPQTAPPHARKTERLSQSLQDIAFTAGGEAGARLAKQLGMPSSGGTLLRLIRCALPPSAAKARGCWGWMSGPGPTG